jgi:hypothetical protein
MDLLKENISRIRQLMILEDNLEKDINLSKSGSDQDIIQKGPSTNDGFDDDSDGMSESEITEDDDTTETKTETNTDTKSDTGSSITPWESGVGRGPANPITSTKREDKTTRGPGNTLTGKMQIRRTLGPTGKNYK